MKYTVQFEQFWKLYPGRTNDRGRIIKNDKEGAALVWMKLTTEQRKLAMTNHPEQGKYTPDARKWLKHKRWQDEDVTAIAEAKEKQAQIMRKRNQHPDDTEWIMEQSPDKLREFINQWPQYEWRIKEVRPEIFDNIAKGGD